MTIELIPEVTQLQSPVEFMTYLKTALIESLPMEDDLKFTCTLMHRDQTDTAHATLGVQVNGGEQFVHSLDLKFDTVEDIIDLCLMSFPSIKITSITRKQLSNQLLSVFSQEYDEVELSELLDKYVFKGSAFQGLISEIEFNKTSNMDVTLSYRLGAEIYADTEKEEREFLESKGADPDLCHRSSPNKIVPLSYLELTPFKSIHC